jgi:hypothetical protein
LKTWRKFLPVVFLILADLLLLLFIYDDYGIGWDENSSRDIGVHNALVANKTFGYLFFEKEALHNRVMQKLPTEKQQSYLNDDYLDQYQYRMYGPAFELGLVGLEAILGIEDDRSLYLMRHVVTHLFFLFGLLVFYLLLFHHFQDWRISLLGTFMLLMIPRLFAHSFFNPKDIPFLVSCILSAFTMVRFLDRPGWKWACLHGLTCAIAVDIRIIGIIFPALTIGMAGLEILLSPIKKKIQKQSHLKWSFFFLIATTLFSIALWPYAWEDPWGHFIFSLKSMSDYPWQGSLLFLGKIYTPVEYLPASFFPVWFGVINPPVLLLGFMASLFNLLSFKRVSFTSTAKTDRLLFIALVLFIVPAVLPVLLQSVLYDDCRHLFFVYPFFIIASLYGFLWIYEKISNKMKLKRGHFYLLTTLILMPVLIKMIRIHPYQNVYFNDFAGKNIAENFEIDYWGVSYKEGLDFILETTDI